MYKWDYFGIGVGEVTDTFNLTKYKRKELEKYNLLFEAYTYETRAYGTYLDVPVYTIDSYLDLLGEDIDELLKEERKIAGICKNKKDETLKVKEK